MDVRIGATAPAGAEIGLTLYGHLTSRSAFRQTLTGQPPGSPLTHTTPVPIAGLPSGAHGGVALSVDVVRSSHATPAPPAGTPFLDLTCTPSIRECTGVYPVVVSLYRPDQTGSPVSRFTTYLTYVQSRSTATAALRFAWVVPLADPVTVNEDSRDPATAVARPTKAATAAFFGLATSLTQYAKVPVTLDASPQTLQALDASAGKGQRTAAAVAAMSHDQATREIPPQSYVPIDLGALSAAGENGEITGQMTAGASVLRSLHVQTADSHTWVATGSVGNALGAALADPEVAADHLVVPEDQLAPAQSGTSTSRQTWSYTFPLTFTKGAPTIQAAAADREMGRHFTADPKQPALDAVRLLADLAMVHFEAPFTSTPRGIVAVPPTGWRPNSTFDNLLLAGLATNPIVTPVTLDGFFASVHQAGARHLDTAGPGPSLPHGLAHQISTARLRLTGFDTVVRPRSTPVLAQLDQLLLASEASTLAAAGQSAAVATFSRSLDAQLSQITFATGRSVTLTARTGSVPITILSTAPYRVVGLLTMTGEKFQFPQGSTRNVTIDHPTTPVRVQVVVRTSGDLPIKAQLDAADGNLIIAQGQLTVRSTATSIVGIVLTAAALLVLLAWWARTWRAGRRKRLAAKAQRVGGG